MITLTFAETAKARGFIGERVLASKDNKWVAYDVLKEVREYEHLFVVGDTGYSFIAVLDHGELPIVRGERAKPFIGWYGEFFDSYRSGDRSKGVLCDVDSADCVFNDTIPYNFFQPIRIHHEDTKFKCGDVVEGKDGNRRMVIGVDPSSSLERYLIGSIWCDGKEWEKVDD